VALVDVNSTRDVSYLPAEGRVMFK
jgi:hypothetical protein